MKPSSHEMCHSRDAKDRSSSTGVIGYIRSYLSNRINQSSGNNDTNSSRLSSASALAHSHLKNSVVRGDRCHRKVDSSASSASSSSSCKGTNNHLFNHSSDRKSYSKPPNCHPDSQVKGMSSSTNYKVASNGRSCHKYNQTENSSSFHGFNASGSLNCDRIASTKSTGLTSNANSTFSLTSGYSSSSSKGSLMPLFDPRAEITRKYIVPPPNRSISDISSLR